MAPLDYSIKTLSDVTEHSSSTHSTMRVEPLSKPSRKSLSFDLDRNETFFITHVDDMDDDVWHDTYYIKEDYDQIKRDIIPIIRRMMMGKCVPENNLVTARGLEFRTRDGAIRRQLNKSEGIQAVLEEQMHQQVEGVYNDERLRLAYRTVSAQCQSEAEALAHTDELWIKQEYGMSPSSSKGGLREGLRSVVKTLSGRSFSPKGLSPTTADLKSLVRSSSLNSAA